MVHLRQLYGKKSVAAFSSINLCLLVLAPLSTSSAFTTPTFVNRRIFTTASTASRTNSYVTTNNRLNHYKVSNNNNKMSLQQDQDQEQEKPSAVESQQQYSSRILETLDPCVVLMKELIGKY